MPTPYTVKPGDSVSTIAARFGFTSWQEIYYHPDNSAFRAKRPNPNLIMAGDVVMIPSKGSSGGTPPVVVPPPVIVPPPVAPPVTARTCDLPAGSVFSMWPAELLATLCRSYQAHAAGNPYLDNSFWGGEPANFEEALNRLGTTTQNAVKWVHSRATVISGLWPFVAFIHNIWVTDSHGFAFTCTDKGKLRSFLDSSSSFCRDIPIMMSDHQAAGPAQCWREIVNETAGLHICLPKDDTAPQNTVAGESSMHVDPHQIVTGKDGDGTCSYSALGTVLHGKDVGAGVAKRFLERRLKDLEKAAEEAGEFWKGEPKGPKW